MLRRSLLTVAAPFAALTLAGCPASTGALTPAQIIADANGVVADVSFMLSSLVAAGIVPASIATTLTADMQVAQKLLTGLSTSLPSQDGASILQQVLGALTPVLAAAGGLGIIPPPYSLIMTAAIEMLPVFEVFVERYFPSAAPRAVSPSPNKVASARVTLGIAVLS